MSKRIRIYTDKDVAAHSSAESCWVSYNGKVYDVTRFLDDHPGGDDFILKYAGKDVGEVMKDPEEHVHSESAYGIMDEFLIGRLGQGENVVSDDWVAPDDFHPEETDTVRDFEKNQFLDLRRPMLLQLLRADFSKSYYLQQVHQPRHLSTSAPLFGPVYLEIFSKTPWYVIPCIWLPIAGYLFARSLVQFTLGNYALPLFTSDPLAPLKLLVLTPPSLAAVGQAIPCFLFGNLVWTFLEYTMHRFLFHLDDYLPDHPYAFAVHFTLHGIHHYLPMDQLRLVMPPALFAALAYPFTQLAHALFPANMANAIISGAFTFYVIYDVMHYVMHHKRLPAFMTEIKKYHLAHHYKNFELGFGVTSKVWDYVFNTVLPM